MILVAGLAVAGLVGIAAAFYFSIRTGRSGYKRNSRRSAASSRAGADRKHGSRGSAATGEWAANDGLPVNNSPTANAGRSANARRSANAGRSAARGSANYRAEAHAGPNDGTDSGQEPGLVSGPGPVGRRAQAEVPTLATPAYHADPDAGITNTPGPGWPIRHGDPTPEDAPTPLSAFGPPAATTGSRAAARLARASHAAVVPGTPEDPVSPAKAIKSRRRVGWRKGSDIDEEMWPTEAFGGLSDDQFWDDLASDKPLQRTARTAHQDAAARHRPLEAASPADSARGNGRRGVPTAANTSGHPGPQPRTADRTTVSPATQMLPAIARQPATQTSPAATRPPATQPVQGVDRIQPIPADLRPTAQFPAGASQPMRAAAQPGEARGRRQAGAGEDPLTSSAFSLRASGPVDGRSNQPPSGSREVGREQGSGGGWPGDGAGPAEAYSGTSAYLYPGRPSSERRSRGQSQPYGGSRSRREAGTDARPPSTASTSSNGDFHGAEPRRPAGQGPWPGYQGPALPAEGQRRPRDPRDDYRRY